MLLKLANVTKTNGQRAFGIDWSGIGVLFAIIAALGGMALAPLYIVTGNQAKSIEDLNRQLGDHKNLSSHPVMQQRVDGEVKRLDEQIRLERESVANLWTDNKRLESILESHRATTSSKFIEVETQFDADSQLRNVQFSDQQRTNSILWGHIPNLGQYPTGPFAQPNISNRHSDK